MTIASDRIVNNDKQVLSRYKAVSICGCVISAGRWYSYQELAEGFYISKDAVGKMVKDKELITDRIGNKRIVSGESIIKNLGHK